MHRRAKDRLQWKNYHNPIMKQPKISIITVNFNNKNGLRTTMDSVLGQTFKDYEYIVIDGGSSDGSKEVIAEKADRLAYWCSEKDGGIYNGMNKGVRHASGEYVLFLNSGDRLYDETVLEKISGRLGEADIVYGDLILYYPDENKSVLQPYPDKVTVMYLRDGSLPHPASFIRTAMLKETPYDEDYRIIADWVFFCKKIVYENCSTQHVSMPVSVFAMDGISNNKEKHDRERQKADRELFPPLIAELSDTIWLYEKKGMGEIYTQLAATKKLHKRLKPLMKFALWMDKALKKKSQGERGC